MVAVALLIGGGLSVAHAASAEEATTVTAVTGGAVGYSSSVGLSGGPAKARGPAETGGCTATRKTSCSPSVGLPATGGSELATDPDGAVARYGPTDLFKAASLSATTQGTTGAAGKVTSSASATDIGPNPLTATEISSTCTANAAGVTATTAITGGHVVTRTNPTTGKPSEIRAVDPAPAPNTVVTGTHDHTGDTFKAVFNEQIKNPDGSLTVNAYHEYLLGPTAVGDLVVGQATCGVTSATAEAPPAAAVAPTATKALTAPQTKEVTPLPAALRTESASGTESLGSAAAPSATGSLAAAATPSATGSLAAAATPSVLPAGTQGAGAYGFYVSVGLFGGAPNVRGPTPKVDLPAGGAEPALTASEPTGKAQFGPATVYESGEMKVSAQGTGTSSTSSASAADVGPTQVQAKLASSTCSSTGGNLTGSASFTGGRLTLGTDPDNVDALTNIPENPPPNTKYMGTIIDVGDTFEVVVNEQEVIPNGIVVNAVHLKLLGPTAVGDLVIGQSRCLKSGAASGGTSDDDADDTSDDDADDTMGGTAGGSRSSGSSTSGSGSRTPMASTGIDPPVVPGLALVVAGSALLVWSRRRRVRPEP